jgi:hypothetical protein
MGGYLRVSVCFKGLDVCSVNGFGELEWKTRCRLEMGR